MGFLDKIKEFVNGFINRANESAAQKAEEERKKREEAEKKAEEERKKLEEENRFNPNGKSLSWFSSEDGIQSLRQYITAQNYILDEQIVEPYKKFKSKYPSLNKQYFIDAYYKGAKLPSMYFESLADAIDAQALIYVGPIEMLVKILSLQAKPFYIDEDGEPQQTQPILTPEEVVSVEKNPVLNFVKNFDCFKLDDDVQGTWKDKSLCGWPDCKKVHPIIEYVDFHYQHKYRFLL